MTTFDKREESFEKKFALDEELKFKAEARRNKLLGLWAANELGMSPDTATAYARDIVAASLEQAGDRDVIHKLTRDFGTKGMTISEQRIRQKMNELLAEAIAQVKAGS